MKTFYFILTLLLSQSTTVYAQIKLPKVISSNMVLQRNSEVNIWGGWASENEEIILNASWQDTTLKTKANKNGEWRIKIKTTDSKQPQTLILNGKTSEIKLENILLGEVWICSGQSNMEHPPIKGFSAQPTYGALQNITKSRNPNLRLFTLNKKATTAPLKDVESYVSWSSASPETVADFSAVGYYFGQQLQETLDVPVGLIFTARGGSTVQAWMSKEVVEKFDTVNPTELNEDNNPQKYPTGLFNAMISPIIPYTIKGAIWYQGESNRHEPERYSTLFTEMVKNWRDYWKLGDFPFYYAQITPFSYGKNKDIYEAPGNTAFLREAQLTALESIPNSAMVVTLDAGDENWIHPPKKKQVADRLLYCALNKTYDFKTIDSDSPMYDSHKVIDATIELKFKHAENGLYAYDGLHDFEIAGADKIFYPAKAEIVNRFSVVVQNAKVPNPVAVRYAWKNWIMGSLYDASLLPAPSFRTDNWTDATHVSEN
ncbi:sialic acid-specific 9-O-acetylesterase [Algibacter lectus]|uniref:Sialic acid-specific 9-O-acetylesterase n=1 Tax=Algibacter lectus TaxID=221126 RepID=A0A090X1V4_9FLAO|nr:sialate O-acetylesterase [Algibacter lectus]GAL82039.1 sialic acid-specific 9-O-acetylesterase [Algibacter lectus]